VRCRACCNAARTTAKTNADLASFFGVQEDTLAELSKHRQMPLGTCIFRAILARSCEPGVAQRNQQALGLLFAKRSSALDRRHRSSPHSCDVSHVLLDSRTLTRRGSGDGARHREREAAARGVVQVLATGVPTTASARLKSWARTSPASCLTILPARLSYRRLNGQRPSEPANTCPFPPLSGKTMANSQHPKVTTNMGGLRLASAAKAECERPSGLQAIVRMGCRGLCPWLA